MSDAEHANTKFNIDGDSVGNARLYLDVYANSDTRVVVHGHADGDVHHGGQYPYSHIDGNIHAHVYHNVAGVRRGQPAEDVQPDGEPTTSPGGRRSGSVRNSARSTSSTAIPTDIPGATISIPDASGPDASGGDS